MWLVPDALREVLWGRGCRRRVSGPRKQRVVWLVTYDPPLRCPVLLTQVGGLPCAGVSEVALARWSEKKGRSGFHPCVM